MGTSKNNSGADIRWYENSILCSLPPDYIYFDEVTASEQKLPKAKSEILRRFKNLLEDFELFGNMTEEERQAFHSRITHKKSYRRIGREIHRDHKTAKSRYDTAIEKVGKFMELFSLNAFAGCDKLNLKNIYNLNILHLNLDRSK
ncbi:MAG: hypothetical protein PHW79_11935 [Candidatus Marinimicrobia bacterium]|nr:hypothetical protein [Candidatus Neomarinimicrobiota bacterium]